jgi:hypothetical protein
VGDVGLDGAVRHEEALADPGIGQSFGDQYRDGLLGGRQALPAVPRPCAGSPATPADPQSAQGRLDTGVIASGPEPVVALGGLAEEVDGAGGGALPCERRARLLAG